MSMKKGQTQEYPYALTREDKETPLNLKPTPEQIGRDSSLHSQAWTSDIESTNIKFLTGKNPTKNISSQKQRNFIRNLYYRVKYQKKRADDKLIKLEEVLKTTNPKHSPELYAKLERDLIKTKGRLLEIIKLKEKYGLEE